MAAAAPSPCHLKGYSSSGNISLLIRRIKASALLINASSWLMPPRKIAMPPSSAQSYRLPGQLSSLLPRRSLPPPKRISEHPSLQKGTASTRWSCVKIIPTAHLGKNVFLHMVPRRSIDPIREKWSEMGGCCMFARFSPPPELGKYLAFFITSNDRTYHSRHILHILTSLIIYCTLKKTQPI